MKAIHTYLNFNGQAEEAFNFYKSIFGGEFQTLQRMSDVPKEAGGVSGKEEDYIMHVALPVGKDDMLMASDILESQGQKLVVGNNVSLSVHAESREEADKIYNALSKGGEAVMPMDDMFWGSYYGMCTDKFGINWMVSYDQPK